VSIQLMPARPQRTSTAITFALSALIRMKKGRRPDAETISEIPRPVRPRRFFFIELWCASVRAAPGGPNGARQSTNSIVKSLRLEFGPQPEPAGLAVAVFGRSREEFDASADICGASFFCSAPAFQGQHVASLGAS